MDTKQNKEDSKMKEMIYLEDVCLDFGSSFSLDHLSFQVMSGEVFGFLGPSGAGKTTTMKLLTKQLLKKSGEIRILGKEIDKVEREDYERIGILSDTSGLYERMTIEENLNFFAALRNVPKSRLARALWIEIIYYPPIQTHAPSRLARALWIEIYDNFGSPLNHTSRLARALQTKRYL